jgi:hypothetical protein
MGFNFSEITGVSVKAPVPPDAIPQERITGDVLRGYGPRRGNLERLLRYWRPIMRREGGFRRCRVILANHPELYPLNNICAWLHHETTGLWPNEGCHHPGMKNCRRKLRGVVRGSLISDSEFAQRLSRLRGAANAGKGMDMMWDSENDNWDNEDSMNMPDHGPMAIVVTEDDLQHAIGVLRDFLVMEPKFVNFLNDDNNWDHEGEDEDGKMMTHQRMYGEKDSDCGCG